MDKLDESRHRARPYLEMAEGFLRGRSDAKQFHDTFLGAFKRDEHLYAAEIGKLLREMFAEVECFEPDPVLRDALKARRPSFTVDERQLRTAAESFARRLAAALD